jgi:oligopeptide/dipeptide ABC transporter ATP-binding protein
VDVLRVENLTVDLRLEGGDLRPVDGVSFAIEAGEAFGLVGESGSGKSMTALAIMRLLDPRAAITDGHVWFQEEDLASKDQAAMQRVCGRQLAMIFQEPMTSLNPAFTIGEQIAEMYRYHLGLGVGDARRRAVAMLERVQIAHAREMYGKYPHEFSGGMRQRVMIAMALACEPALLIADEPTTALDVTIQAQILGLLQELQREMGMALLFISHNLEVVAQLCGRVAVMYAAKLAEVGETVALFEAPAHPYTEGLIRSIPRRGRPLRAIPGSICDLRAPPPGCRFHSRCGYAQARCASEVPPLRALPGAGRADGARQVACHFPVGAGGGAP